ncbi:hypothetical protein [Paragemmobacter ruber]|uniref:Helix-turn-helix domain-containing protein n=1 Tax=Paragemmobacter ruber TaxID=1985673 RepID=A0ABW9Y1Y1_9RHOB|nr:hypothetical protein [Rhodobacter ruber]NBE05947.1 hypothetical protein [Rhodobacter ruber]
MSAGGGESWAALHAAGLTATEAARRRGRHVTGAFSWAKRAGVTWPTGVRAGRRVDWAALHAEGLTATEAAARAGCCCSAAYRWARQAGVKWPEPARKSADWAALHAQGLTARAAAAAMGCTVQRAYQWASRAEVRWSKDRPAETAAADRQQALRLRAALDTPPLPVPVQAPKRGPRPTAPGLPVPMPEPERALDPLARARAARAAEVARIDAILADPVEQRLRGGPFSEPNADACRTLWAAVLREQLALAGGSVDAYPHGGRTEATRQNARERAVDQARRWFDTADCDLVCQFVGLDADAVRAAVRRGLQVRRPGDRMHGQRGRAVA